MPRFLFHVDRASRKRTSLTHAIVTFSDTTWVDIVGHCTNMQEVRFKDSSVTALRLIGSATWFSQPPFGDLTAELDPSGTAVKVPLAPLAAGVAPVRVALDYTCVGSTDIVLECVTKTGLVARTERLEVQKGVHFTVPEPVRTWDDVEWGVVMRGERGGVPQPYLRCGVWFVMGENDGEFVPRVLTDMTDERRAKVRELVDRLREVVLER